MSTIVLRCALGDLDASGRVHRLPARGDWLAHLVIGWPEAPAEGSPASLVYTRESGAQDIFTGTIRRSRKVANTENLAVTIVGGKGRLLDPLPPRHHTAGTSTLPAGVVAASIAAETGEALAAGVEAALDAFPLPRWTRIAGTGWDALDALAASLGLGWRVLPDGTIWIGVETWPPILNSPVDGVPEDGAVTYNPDGAPLLPGYTIDGMRARWVEYTWTPRNISAEVRAGMNGDAVRPVDLDLYRATYAGTVLDQDAADGTLHIACDDARLGKDLRGIPLRVGLPGVTATMPGGSRVRVAFENGDPRGAYAVGIDQDPMATLALALVTDKVDCGTISVVAPSGTAGGPCTISWTAPGVNNLGQMPASMPDGKITGPGHKYAKGTPGP